MMRLYWSPRSRPISAIWMLEGVPGVPARGEDRGGVRRTQAARMERVTERAVSRSRDDARVHVL
ncbi:hypothetical protein V1288_002493 [Bradyrhizobium sp. AZCC 2176]